MPATYTLIASNTLSSSAFSVTFSSINSSYTDILLRFTARTDGSDPNPGFQINGGYTNQSQTYLQATGTTVSSSRTSAPASLYLVEPISTYTTNTFGSAEIYIPNYTVASGKPISGYSVAENNNSTTYFIAAGAALYNSTTAITSLTLIGNNFVSGSSFFLYGIKNT